MEEGQAHSIGFGQPSSLTHYFVLLDFKHSHSRTCWWVVINVDNFHMNFHRECKKFSALVLGSRIENMLQYQGQN